MKIRKPILQLGTYSPPLEGRDPNDYLLMDFNESPLPPPAHVIEALITFIQSNRLQTYPSYGDFLEKLGKYTEVPSDHLILTNGSDQAIDIILRALLGEGDQMILAKPGFSMFFQVAGTLGAKCISPQYHEDMSFPFHEIMEAVTSQTRLIVIITPNNPTGTSASLEQIKTILQTYPKTAVLVDEAYFEFTGQTCVSLLKEHPNLIVIRTFSKAFAIPSLRLGYAVAHPFFIEHLYKIRGPYDVNMLSLVAALEQLKNPGPWQEIVREVITEAKPALEQFFREHEVEFHKGDANFMLVVPDDVNAAVGFLKQNKILVRPMRPPIENMFRLSVGTLDGAKRFMEVYAKYLVQ
ncbi:MAG: histidinol-phosphate aminotransferase family protein [SAR324 cluster bacterium]|nr:histidinol-phosphate aminotransferase family protein [SAR324 cluster bacterium]